VRGERLTTDHKFHVRAIFGSEKTAKVLTHVRSWPRDERCSTSVLSAQFLGENHVTPNGKAIIFEVLGLLQGLSFYESMPSPL
jgi:hypothetical protein